MLLYFTIGGFCSFSKEQDLFLTVYPNTRLKNTKYEKNFLIDKTNRVMKSAIIFGANASGKTNCILGLERFVQIILNGISLPKDFDEKKLNYSSKSIKFEIGFLDDENNIYDYSLEFNKDNILNEKFDVNDKNIYEFKNNILYSGYISKEISQIFSIKSTEPILKKLKDFNIEEIDNFIKVVQNINIRRNRVFNLEAKEVLKELKESFKSSLENKKDKVLSIIQFLDCTIKDFKFEKLGNKNGESFYEIYFLRGKKKNKYYLGNESEGIKKIMNLIIELLDIYNGKTIIIDELDSSISTVSLIKLFNNFVNVEENKKGQLIVTSHNVFLFNNNIFEPQQIYIVNKGDNLNSELYSLSEFKIRTEKENLYQDFLKGKFGGING